MIAPQAPLDQLSAEEDQGCPFCGAAATPDQVFCAACGQPGATLPAGTLLRQHLQIVEVVSTSSTGAVYRAGDPRHKREVAVKELLAPVGSSAVERAALQRLFVREARTLSHLKHPCLVELLDSFSQNGRHYLIMPFLPGGDLKTQLVARERGLAEGQVRGWAFRLIELVEYFQERHPAFVHGEIMPSHLMLKADGTPCLVSYGVAWWLGLRPRLVLPGANPDEAAVNPATTLLPAATTSSSGAQLQNGSAHRPSFSDSRGSAKGAPDISDELYSLGATLHSLLTGRDVFAGAATTGQPFPPVRDFAPRVSVAMAEAVGQSVSSEPRRRLRSPQAMRVSLQPGWGVLRRATETPKGRPSRIVGLGLLVAAVALIATLLFFADHTSAPTSSDAVSPKATNTLNLSPAEANPLVSGTSLPVVSRTVPISDAFMHSSTEWPARATRAYQQNAELWLDNSAGIAPLKLTRTSYATGRDGFTVRATIRLAQGPSNASYGLVAADSPGAQWDNVMLLLRADGQWTLVRNHVSQGSAVLRNWQPGSMMRAGRNSPNEVALTVEPGKGGQPPLLSVAINGVVVANHVSAWTAMPSGRIGLVAGPGARVVADTISVDAPRNTQPTVEEHFLDNHRSWSVGQPRPVGGALQKKLLRVRPTAGQVWRMGATPVLRSTAPWSAYSGEATLALRTTTAPSAQAGGLVFARPARGSSADALAAVFSIDGRVSVVALGQGTTKTLLEPLVSGRVRPAQNPNDLRVEVTPGTQNAILVKILVNGSLAVTYTGDSKGLVPAFGVVAIGGGASVEVTALRIWGVAFGQRTR